MGQALQPQTEPDVPGMPLLHCPFQPPWPSQVALQMEAAEELFGMVWAAF